MFKISDILAFLFLLICLFFMICFTPLRLEVKFCILEVLQLMMSYTPL